MTSKETYNHITSLTIDVQNDFCPGGSLAIHNGDDVVEPMNQLNRWVRQQAGKVYFSRDWHPGNTLHFLENGGEWPKHCVQYTDGAAFHERLEVLENDIIINKGTYIDDPGYSGFGPDTYFDINRSGKYQGGIYNNLSRYYDNELNTKAMWMAFLIGGLATDYCVKETTLDALHFARTKPSRVGVYVVSNAIKAVNLTPHDGELAIQEMQAAGAKFVTLDQVISGEAFALRPLEVFSHD